MFYAASVKYVWRFREPVKSESIQTLSSASLFASAFLIPLIMKQEFDVNEAEIGVVVAAYGTALLISSMAFGRLADVRGRRLVLQAGLLVCTVTSALQFLAFDTTTLLIVRVIMGFAAGTFPSSLMAYAYESHGKAGKFASFGALGWGIGTLLAGVFAAYSLFAPFLVSSVLFGIAFAISLALPFPKQTLLKVPLFPTNVIRRNAASYAGILLRHTGACMIWVIYPIFLAKIRDDAMWIGIVYAINAGTQFIVMQMLDKYDGRKLFVVGLLLSALTFFLFIVSTNEWMIMADQVVLGCSWACTYVGALKVILEKGAERSTSSGLLDSTLSLSSIFGSLAGGLIAVAFGDYMTMWVAIGLSFAGLAIFLTLSNGQTKGSGRSQGQASAQA